MITYRVRYDKGWIAEYSDENGLCGSSEHVDHPPMPKRANAEKKAKRIAEEHANSLWYARGNPKPFTLWCRERKYPPRLRPVSVHSTTATRTATCIVCRAWEVDSAKYSMTKHLREFIDRHNKECLPEGYVCV